VKRFRQILKWIGIAIGASFLAFIGYFYYSLSTAPERVRPLCAQIKAGTPLADLKAFASSNGLSMANMGADAKATILFERKSYGRHTCAITLDGGVVTKSDYSHLD
jgi:hypothetical protein